MRKYLLLFICTLLCSCVFAQERLFTDKEHGGAENGIFGKVNDELNVSPTGQLSYEIPIPALPGTGGVKPNISITYNSSTKNGLAGYGFDIAGLSIISRVPSDRFHDGMARAIELTDNDRFSLDGQRLIAISYNIDKVEYRTENNSFSKIFALGSQKNPTSFQVYTKSGLIYDYVSVAKALGKNESDSTLFWLVSKVSDTKGNYYTVTYAGDASINDYCPLRIDYTGNSAMSLTPYASMRFAYFSNPDTPITYVNGVRVKRSKVLSSISLYMGSQFVRGFQFSYNEVDRKYQLTKVGERVAGDFKNSTQLTWSNLVDFNVKNYNYTQSKLIHKATLTVGDFNGDGMADIFVTPENDKAGWTGWKLFVSHGSYFEQVASGSLPEGTLEQVVAGDFNGDGYDDFQAIDKTSSGSNMTQPQVYLNDGAGNFYKQVKGGSVYATDKWHFYTGDFNGDGKVDFVCTSDWNKSNWDGYQLYLMPSDKHSLLTGIKDGLGNITTVDYKYLTDKSVFARGKTQSYPLVSIGSSWPVVSSVTTPDGIGGKNVVSYRYEDALFHKNGRGLLGFAKCYVKDESTNTLNMTQYAVNTDMYVIAPIYRQTSVNGIKIEECNYEYNLTSYAGIFSYWPVRTHQNCYEFNTGQKVKNVETSNEYDKNGNVTKMTVKDGNVETTTINTYADNVEKWHLGRLVASVVTLTNENGTINKKSTFEYDKNSGLLTAEVFAPDNSKLGYRKTYVHDGFGNIIKSTVSSLDNSSERIIQTSYDSKGRFLVSSTNSLGFRESSNTDANTGLVTNSWNYNGIRTDYAYDKFGSLVETSTPISKSLSTTGWSAGMTDAPSNALYFTWSQVTGSPYTIEFYDCLGRLLRKVTQSIDGKKVYVDQVYNAKGQVVKTSEPYYPGGQQYWNTNEYDAVGRTITQTAADGSSYKFQYAGLKTVTTDPLGHTETKVSNLNGLLASSMDNEGSTVVYKYDACGQCIETKGPRTTIRCTYDMAGNRTSLNDPDVGNLTSRRDISRNLVEAFSYDGLNRLTTVRKNGQITQSISYDAAGNITAKSDVGTYSYVDGSNKLSSISNCKRTIATWDAISYNSFDKVTQVVSGGKTMTLSYGPDFSRVLSDMDGVKTYYVDNLFEQKINNTKTSNINYVFAFGKLVAIVSQEASTSVRYIHHDHLGSIQAYSDENGKLYQELSYDAWGLRRNPADWSVFAVLAASKAYDEHGFGGHEHIDLFDLINMDGRMYDPVVGRFISADPFIQSPDFMQSLNRYAYCVNNPLSLIDPSGYSWFSKNWKSLLTSAVGIAVGVVTAGTGAGPTVALLAGAAGGAAGALTGALLNGSNIGQIAKTTFTGAFWGAIGGLANNLAGRIDEFWWRISAHTVSEGVMEGLQGGNLLHGFMMGAASSLGGNFIDKNMESLGRAGEVAANSILSGTLDEIGGGKFANGAFTGAFTILFNDMMHGKLGLRGGR